MLSQIIVLIRKILLSLILLIVLILKWPNMAMIFITFSAVLVALFREDIYLFFRPPILKISVPETLGGDEVDAITPATGNFVEKQAYLVINVENKGLGIAKNIEVYFNGLESNVVINFGRYKYVPLITSWTLEPFVRSLPQNVGRRFSVCYLRESSRKELNFISKRNPNALRKIKCTPGSISTFKFEVVAYADNAKLIRREIEIEFMGDYLKGFKVKS